LGQVSEPQQLTEVTGGYLNLTEIEPYS